MDRTGKAFRGGPRDALLADAVEARILGAAFGWHRAMDTIGAAIGPLLAIAYLQFYSDNLRGIFLWALVPGLAAVAFTLSVRESAVAPRAKSVPKWSWSGATPGFRNYLITWGIFSLANSSDVFLLLKMKQAGVTLQITILIYCFYNLIYALSSPFLGKLSDRAGRKPLLAFGFLIFAGVYFGFAFASQFWQFTVLFAVYGLYMAATDGVGKAYAVDLVSASHRATGVGMLATVTGLCTLAASTLAGVLWDHAGPASTFLVGAAGALLAALSLFRISKNK
jgi:MFS family permease